MGFIFLSNCTALKGQVCQSYLFKEENGKPGTVGTGSGYNSCALSGAHAMVGDGKGEKQPQIH